MRHYLTHRAIDQVVSNRAGSQSAAGFEAASAERNCGRLERWRFARIARANAISCERSRASA